VADDDAVERSLPVHTPGPSNNDAAARQHPVSNLNMSREATRWFLVQQLVGFHFDSSNVFSS
jgi:hypothetical protein